MLAMESEPVPEPTTATSGSIKAIHQNTVHKICSGQVVLSLAVAVKELVENAIDAGATLIEVKLYDQGLGSLEVIDNGSGVEEHSLAAMTAKYHTSKLREFDDLQGVETFGFRGEALSSLCALSDMAIVTRHKSTNVGLKVELDHDGKVKKRTPCARSIGTTVSLVNLFGTLPVRRRDFIRNIKKEFSRMCQILQAYCLVAVGVRIICTNHTPKGGKSVVLQTNGAKDVLDNISALFGSRQTGDLVRLKSPFEEGQLTKEDLLSSTQDETGDSLQVTAQDIERLNAKQFELEGYISSCSHGAGRSSKDRQYFYVNSRPCDTKNVAKLVNEIYHRYNVHQFPFIYLNVITARSDVDVNLTPDKRQLLINNEKILLIALKKSLLNTFGSIPSTYKIQNSTITSMLKVEKSEPDNDSSDVGVADLVPISSSQKFMRVLSQWRHTGDTVGIAPPVPAKRKCTDEIAVRTLKLQKIQKFLTLEEAKASNEICGYKSESGSDDDGQEGVHKQEKQPMVHCDSVLDVGQICKESKEFDALTQATLVERIDCKVQTPAKAKGALLQFESKFSSPTNECVNDDNDDDNIVLTPATLLKNVELDDSLSEEEDNYTCSEINTSLAELELNLRAEENLQRERQTKAKLDRLRFKSEISPSQNQKAEAELQKEISKESFAQMEILGQFNLGFIIVKLGTDLFIVDQHATDEKYNFEVLQRSTTLQHQPLAVPQPLELTAVNEMILLDHLEVFAQNGFKFDINQNAPLTRKVRLLGKPFSKNWEFGKDDIDELIFMLQDAPDGTICRPSRIRAMFASRACRKSVMIGKALNKATMRSLITHMGDIEQPWNCPHGRPTMRHLINTAMLLEEEENATAEVERQTKV